MITDVLNVVNTVGDIHWACHYFVHWLSWLNGKIRLNSNIDIWDIMNFWTWLFFLFGMSPYIFCFEFKSLFSSLISRFAEYLLLGEQYIRHWILSSRENTKLIPFEKAINTICCKYYRLVWTEYLWDTIKYHFFKMEPFELSFKID